MQRVFRLAQLEYELQREKIPPGPSSFLMDFLPFSINLSITHSADKLNFVSLGGKIRGKKEQAASASACLLNSLGDPCPKYYGGYYSAGCHM